MNKRNLFGEIRQGIEALSCARMAENSSPTEKLKPEAILSAPVIVPKQGHSIEETKLQGNRAELSKELPNGYKAMSQDRRLTGARLLLVMRMGEPRALSWLEQNKAPDNAPINAPAKMQVKGAS